MSSGYDTPVGASDGTGYDRRVEASIGYNRRVGASVGTDYDRRVEASVGTGYDKCVGANGL